MQGGTEHGASRHLVYLWGVVFIYFSLNQFLQLSVSQTADLDQAEQLILSQSYQLGYSAQPPLYTYIVIMIFALTGAGLAPLLALKAIMLSILVGALMATGARFNFTLHKQLLLVAGVVFIPQIIWESQRDLSHSVLATTIAALTLLQVIEVKQRNNKINYVILGLLIGLGLISKYNYILFLSALLIAIIYVPQYRMRIINWNMVIAVALAFMISAPHFAWAMNNYDIASSSAHKLHMAHGNVFSGLGRAALSALVFLFPFWVFSIPLVAGLSRKSAANAVKTDNGRFLIALLAASMAAVALFVVFTGAQAVKDRWYQPLLFFVPLIVAFFADSDPAKRHGWYIGLAITIAVMVSVALPLRTVYAEKINKYGHPNMPYPSAIKQISESTPEPDFVLAETNLLGGNSKQIFSNSIIQIPTYKSATNNIRGQGIIICGTPNCKSDAMKAWLGDVYKINIDVLKFNEIQTSYYYAPSKKMQIFWSIVTLPTYGNQ